MENKNQKNKNVWYVGLLSFFGGISQDVFSPILPIYLTTILGFDKTVVGIAEGIVSASAYVFRIVAGYLSDKFKKQKPIIFLGYLLSMIGRALLVLFTSLGAVVGAGCAERGHDRGYGRLECCDCCVEVVNCGHDLVQPFVCLVIVHLDERHYDSLAQVIGPTMPSTTRPRTFWKILTAASVRGPKIPSTVTLPPCLLSAV